MKRTHLLLILTALLLGLNQSAHAYWPVSVDENLNVAADPDTSERYPSILPFTNSSVLITYWKFNYLYQIIDRFGDFQYQEDQLVTPGTQYSFGTWVSTNAQMVPDSSGGAFIVYSFPYGDNIGVWGQHIDSLGNRLWGDTGIRILPAADSDYQVKGDGFGGFLVVCSPNNDVFAQRVDEYGNLLWGEEGISVAVGPLYSQECTIAHDGEGGAFVIWEEGQFGYNLLGQHFDQDGTPLWPENLVINPGGAWYNSPVPDGYGGFILDMNNGGYGNDLYRFNAAGAEVWHVDNLSYFIDGGVNRIVNGEDNFVYLGFFWDAHFKGQRVDVRGVTYWQPEGAWFNLSLGHTYGTGNPDFVFRDPIFYNLYVTSPEESGPHRYYISGLNQDGNRTLGDNGVHLQTTDYDGYYRKIAAVADGGVVAAMNIQTHVNPPQFDLRAKRVNPDGTLGGPLHLLVDLEPESASIQIPPTGGSFTYNIAIEDTYVVYSDFDAWVEVTMPGGDTREITVREGIHIDYNSVIERFDLVQNVPDWAPTGDYTYTLYVGDHDYPDWYWSKDEFGFEKVDTGSLRGSEPITSANDEAIFAPNRGSNPPLPPLSKGGKTQHPPYQGGRLAAGEAGGSEHTWQLTGFFDELSGTSSATQINKGLQPLVNISQPLALAISPNPFNPTTAISFQLSAFSHVNLTVYDISGRKVATLIDGFRDAGYHQVTLDGSILASGVYVYRLEVSESGTTIGTGTPTTEFEETGKMVLLK
ncbi:T9SS type A sorting domain-containing protein [bacterium]|nr:T9SS type A sorting domain-containing protein [bacterium]